MNLERYHPKQREDWFCQEWRPELGVGVSDDEAAWGGRTTQWLVTDSNEDASFCFLLSLIFLLLSLISFCWPSYSFVIPHILFCHPSYPFCYPSYSFCHPSYSYCCPSYSCCHILLKVQRQELRAAVQPAAGEGGHPDEEERREGRLQRDSCTADRQPACARENRRAENHPRWNFYDVLLTQKILRKGTPGDSQAWGADPVAEFWRHVRGATRGGDEGGWGGRGRGRCKRTTGCCLASVKRGKENGNSGWVKFSSPDLVPRQLSYRVFFLTGTLLNS